MSINSMYEAIDLYIDSNNDMRMLEDRLQKAQQAHREAREYIITRADVEYETPRLFTMEDGEQFIALLTKHDNLIITPATELQVRHK